MYQKRKITHWLAVLIIGIAVLSVTDVSGETAGNVDGMGTVDLKDVILSLQICAGTPASGTVPDADVNGDGRIGLAEAVYGLQSVISNRWLTTAALAPEIIFLFLKKLEETTR